VRRTEQTRKATITAVREHDYNKFTICTAGPSSLQETAEKRESCPEVPRRRLHISPFSFTIMHIAHLESSNVMHGRCAWHCMKCWKHCRQIQVARVVTADSTNKTLRRPAIRRLHYVVGLKIEIHEIHQNLRNPVSKTVYMNQIPTSATKSTYMKRHYLNPT